MHAVFSPDARRLAIAPFQGPIEIYDITQRLQRGKLQIIPWTKEQTSQHWRDLGSQEGTDSNRALWATVAGGRDSVQWIKARIKPVPILNRSQVRLWLQDLGSRSFRQREAATHSLEALGDGAFPDLQRALASKPPLEVRRRLELLIESIRTNNYSKPQLRAWRSVKVLEQIGSPEAEQVLTSLASGEPRARLTHMAKDAIIRIQRSKLP